MSEGHIMRKGSQRRVYNEEGGDIMKNEGQEGI